jgi:alpha-L-fucosidase
VRLDRLVIQEAIALGQRVQAWTVEAEVDGRWTALTSGTTIGYKRIATFPPVTTSSVRVTIEKGLACPAISAVGAYLAPQPGAR